ncbi:MAG: FkbM family methyltransferase [Betaproteobacteria bacterium]
MRRRGTFYEIDVLEGIRQYSNGADNAAAVDVGAFIGTHSVYMAKFCGLAAVLSFEANPSTFPHLLHNLAANGVAAVVDARNKALGARRGTASIVSSDPANQGASSVGMDASGLLPIVNVSTLDEEIGSFIPQRAERVSTIKIDVEGAEIEVLKGAARVIERYRPLICIEVHSFSKLRNVLALLRPRRYWIVDCLGYSPTYLLEPSGAHAIRRSAVNALWLIRSLLPQGGGKVGSWARWYFRRAAAVLHGRGPGAK